MSKPDEVAALHEAFAQWWRSLGETHTNSRIKLCQQAFSAGMRYAARAERDKGFEEGRDAAADLIRAASFLAQVPAKDDPQDLMRILQSGEAAIRSLTPEENQ